MKKDTLRVVKADMKTESGHAIPEHFTYATRGKEESEFSMNKELLTATGTMLAGRKIVFTCPSCRRRHTFVPADVRNDEVSLIQCRRCGAGIKVKFGTHPAARPRRVCG